MDHHHHPRSNLFPVLKTSVILQIMEEVDVPLTESELAEPGRCKERVREVFVQLLCMCWGIAPESLSEIPARILEKKRALDHPAIYDDALPEAKFFCLLSKLLRICGYYEFGFKDLAAPQPRRFRRQLSALINFLKFKEEMGHLEANVLAEREELFAALDEVTENSIALKGQLGEARALNREKMLERDAAEAECMEMEAEIAQQNKIQSSIRQETYRLKKTANELKDMIANSSIAMRELRAEERRLSKEVVRSPGRARLEIERANQRLERARKGVAEKKSERDAVRERATTTAEAEEILREAMAAMERMEVRKGECERAAGLRDAGQRRLDESERDLNVRMGEKEKLERRLEQAERQREESAKALESALRGVADELDSAAGQLGAAESERLDGIARIEAGEKKAEELRDHIEGERRAAEEEMERRIASFREFERAYWEKEAEFDGDSPELQDQARPS